MCKIEAFPIIEELPFRGLSVELFANIHNEPFSFFLDSSEGKFPKLGRFSFMGYSPFIILKSVANNIIVTEDTKERLLKGNPFHLLKEILYT